MTNIIIRSLSLNVFLYFHIQVTLCLLAKTSTGRLRRWRDEQCKIVGPLSEGVSTNRYADQVNFLPLFCGMTSILLQQVMRISN